MEIEYSHRVIYADENSAELEIRIERINTYTEGKFYGSISSIPHELSMVRARASADGRIEFDRELLLLGELQRVEERTLATDGLHRAALDYPGAAHSHSARFGNSDLSAG